MTRPDPQPDKGKDDEHGHGDDGDQSKPGDLVRVAIPARDFTTFDPVGIRGWIGRPLELRLETAGALGVAVPPTISLRAKIASVTVPEDCKTVVLWLSVVGD